jgi:hypothetical protein
MDQSTLFTVIRGKALEFGVCEDLAVAIAMTESGCIWPRQSTRFEPAWKYFVKPEKYAEQNGLSLETEMREQATSWGPMQVMGSVCRELGFQGPLPEIFQPVAGAQYGVMKLKVLLSKYKNESDAISAYNQGSPRKTHDGFYLNQSYVEKVMARLKALRAIK